MEKLFTHEDRSRQKPIYYCKEGMGVFSELPLSESTYGGGGIGQALVNLYGFLCHG